MHTVRGWGNAELSCSLVHPCRSSRRKSVQESIVSWRLLTFSKLGLNSLTAMNTVIGNCSNSVFVQYADKTKLWKDWQTPMSQLFGMGQAGLKDFTRHSQIDRILRCQLICGISSYSVCNRCGNNNTKNHTNRDQINSTGVHKRNCHTNVPNACPSANVPRWQKCFENFTNAKAETFKPTSTGDKVEGNDRLSGVIVAEKSSVSAWWQVVGSAARNVDAFGRRCAEA